MAILESTENVNAPLATVTSKEYALAAFIIGCLIQEQVIQINELGSDEVSDLQCGIRIVAACLKNYDKGAGRYNLPFEW